MLVPFNKILGVDLLDSGFNVQDQACIKIVRSTNGGDCHTSDSAEVCARIARYSADSVGCDRKTFTLQGVEQGDACIEEI